MSNFKHVDDKTLVRRTASVDSIKWDEAKKKAQQQGVSLSFILRRLIALWLAGKIILTEKY